jgi:translation initiation factor IF-3
MALAGGGGRFRGRDTRGPQIRINHRIRVPEVRVVDADGSNLGVISTEAALRRAQEVGLDLVEVNPKASPPVCKILDFGKYKYEEKKRASEAKKKQTIVEVKEVKIRPKTDDHDIDVKVRAIRRFIESGNKVKVTCRFRGREIMHPQRAQMQFDVMVKRVEDVANIEQRPTMEARTMALLLAPKPIVFQRLTSLRAQQERERARGERPPADQPQPEDLDEELHEPDDDDEDDDDEDDDDGDDEGAEDEKKE